MSDKKYKREDCIALLCDKYLQLKQQGLSRYPQRSDFETHEVVAIKAFLGPWPRALEAAEVKPPRDDGNGPKQQNSKKAPKARTDALKLSKTDQNGNI